MKTDLRKAVFLLILILVAAECSFLSYGGWKRRTEWQYLDDEGQVKKDEWFQDGSGKTYYLDKEGYMVTGWYLDTDGNWYFLHNVSDGTQGHMYTGWHQISGKWYYFRENAGGPMGSLVVNGTTPDGYQVDGDGVCAEYQGR